MPGRRGGSMFDDASQAGREADMAHERRLGRRRTYNRRREDTDVSPPYFEAFERIATALERIADQLDRSQVSLTVPDSAEESTEQD